MSLKYPPYYTVSAALLTAGGVMEYETSPELGVNIFIRSESDFTPELFKALSQLQSDFIISLSNTLLVNHNDQDLFEKVYMGLSLNISSKKQLIIPVLGSKSMTPIAGLCQLKKYLEEQGCTGLSFPVFNISVSGSQTVDRCCLVISSPEDLSLNGLIENKEVSTLIILPLENIEGLSAPGDVKKRIMTNSVLHGVDMCKIQVCNNRAETEIDLWRNRALLYQDFLMLSKKVQEKEYYDVLNWYKQEYEVLPLWYKRVGHIIKVILGKRTFKSLFSDDVKKYKD